MNKVIDDMDKKIVNLLLHDADMTNRDIASRCKIALGTVNNRIKKLKKSGVIKKKMVLLDFEKIGYQIEVLIAIKIKKGAFHEVAKELASDKNVFLVIDMTGDYDAEILARFYGKRQLDTFIKKLQQQPFVESTSTRLVLNIYREIEIE